MPAILTAASSLPLSHRPVSDSYHGAKSGEIGAPSIKGAAYGGRTPFAANASQALFRIRSRRMFTVGIGPDGRFTPTRICVQKQRPHSRRRLGDVWDNTRRFVTN